MNKGMLLVAIGCGRLPKILDIVKIQSFVVFGSMDELPLSDFADHANSGIIDSKVYFYETGWIVPRRVVAVGDLKKVWFDIPQYVSEEEFEKAFEDYFGAEFGDALDAVDRSFEYNVYNTVYFSIGDIRLIENVTLDQLLEEKGLYRPPNVVVS